MGREKSGIRAKGSILLLGVALAAVVATIGYRSFGTGDAGGEVEVPGDPLATLEQRVEDAPGDVAAWQELGFARFERGEFAASALAYRQATRLDPDEAVLWSALGEALVMDSKRDPLPPEALAAFDRAAEINPGDPRARYFLAVKRDLEGDHKGAIADWLALLEDTPRGAPWESDLARTIEQVGAINSIDVAGRLAAAQSARIDASPSPATAAFAAGDAIPGPSSAQVAAASSIPPGEQRQMAEGMVASLEGKLAADPANVDGWIMLMRSRMTLGQPDRARKALADAVAANPGAAARLGEQGEALGIR